MSISLKDLPLDVQNPRLLARLKYFEGWAMPKIAELVGVNYATVASWKRREDWDNASLSVRLESSLYSRLCYLISIPDKTGGNYKEIDLLMRQAEKTARMRKYETGGNERDLNPNLNARYDAPRSKPVKNLFTPEEVEKLREAILAGTHGHQKIWYENRHQRIRNILKARQIGATFYFSDEAILDAAETARNQIFLSASKAQAHMFKQYILARVRDVLGKDLRGDPLVLGNNGTLYFLGTNSNTAQSYHGNLYFDEYFWVGRFNQLKKVASGMATHKKWHMTYFSTPSSIAHEGYKFWNGDDFNKRRPRKDRVSFDVSHAALKNGALGADGIWRHIVTIEDAIAGGMGGDFDLNQLRTENPADEFANKFMCEFVDDSQSVFPMSLMQRCMVDAWEVWADFSPLSNRPLGYAPVWIGYDPAHSQDSAACVVVAKPTTKGGIFRVLECHQWSGLDYENQAARIKDLCSQYNVEYIGIDTTGVGAGVFTLVQNFFPMVEAIVYNTDVKNRMVLKAHNVICSDRLEFDAGSTNIAASFMAIKRSITPTGRDLTYAAGRSEEVSHADIAWAIMHALSHEPLDRGEGSSNFVMESF